MAGAASSIAVASGIAIAGIGTTVMAAVLACFCLVASVYTGG